MLSYGDFVLLFVVFICVESLSKLSGETKMSDQPTITLDEVARGIQDPTTSIYTKKALEGLLNDFMDLHWGKKTPYTTGQRVIPMDTSLEDLEQAIADPATENQFRLAFVKIADTHKSGDLTPQSKSDGTWDPSLTPVLVLVIPNIHNRRLS